MEWGERLRQQRERAGLSLGQVAEYERVSRQYLSKLEVGTNEPPTWELLARLARRYRTTTDYLLGLTTDPTPRRDKPLPEMVRDLVELASELSPGRQEELLAHARVLEEAEQRERNERQAAMYLDRAEAMGEDVLNALLTALDLARTDGRSAAEAFIRSFWAEKAQQMPEEDLREV